MSEDWRPSAPHANLEQRAALLAEVRAFFAERGVLEVETPLLAAAPVPDLHLHSVATELEIAGETHRRYLQTSPEYAMKRLLAAGSGPIYQLARAVRDGERGRLHNPEFTLLEWYRPGWDHHALMDEVDDLLRATLATPAGLRLTYGALFEQHLGIDLHTATVPDLARCAAEAGIDAVGLDAVGPDDGDKTDASRDAWLQLLLGCVIEPELGRDAAGARRPTFVYDFPASQAALARIRPGVPPVAERFEVYVAGVELANGYYELTDAAEQRRRFDADLAARRAAGRPAVPIDRRLLAALEAGLPPCAGVALGVDRLAMLRAGASSIDEVIAFPIERA